MNEELKRLLDELYTLFYCGIEQGDTISCVISWETYKKIDEILERAKKMHGDGRINDLISRQAAIDALEEPSKVPDTWTDESAIGERMQWEKDVKALKNLPSAQPEPKKGEWNFEEYPDGYYHSECSACGQWFDESAYLRPYNFCPNCGADMSTK